MEFGNERKKEYYEFDLDLSDDEQKNLAELGLELIKEDEAELVNYAVNTLLRRTVEELESGDEELKAKLKELAEAERDSKND